MKNRLHCNDTLIVKALTHLTGTRLTSGLGVASALLMMVLNAGTALAQDASGNPTTKPVGTATRAWLDEQREGINRAEPEPYPADRAATAVRRYESTVGSGDSGSSATRAGTGIGLRSGSAGSSVSSGGTNAGMGR